ncbi:MAG: DUF4430 domain-containing protein [Clostridiales bacterium]|nr:DUF4430 domain-containing protein [Clostridiales bacterium]
MKKLRFTLCLVLVALLAVATFSACKSITPPPPPDTEAIELGSGENTLHLAITFSDGRTESYRIRTDAESVGAAMAEHGMIALDGAGMIVDICGEVADWDADNAYWAFYVDGDYAMAGADGTPIDAGCSYAFVYTKG